MRRRWGAAEARSLGWGGIEAVAAATGFSDGTIRNGIKELDGQEALPTTAQRRPGGGRKRRESEGPRLVASLQRLVDSSTRGDPTSPLRWTCKSTRTLAEELSRLGCSGVAKVILWQCFSLHWPCEAFHERPGQRHKVSHLLPATYTGLMIVFLGMLWLAEAYPWMPAGTRVVGGVIALCGITGIVRTRPLRIPVEIWLCAGFVSWAGLSGSVVGLDDDAFLATLRTCAQLFFLFVGIYGVSRTTGTVLPAMIAVLAVALGLSVYLMYTGYVETGILIERITQRDSMWNPNAIGIFMVLGLSAVLALWPRFCALRARALLAVMASVLLATIIATASRKSFAAVIVLTCVWMWKCNREAILRNIAYALPATVLAVVAYFVIEYVIFFTVLGERIDAVWNEGIESTGRLAMYAKGLELFMSSPLAGIGLGNYAVASGFGVYSHSDFVEVFVSTGVIGGMLYFSLYVCIWLRLQRLRNNQRVLMSVRNTAGVFQSLMIGCFVLGLGVPLFLSPFVWFLLAAICAWSESQVGLQ